MSAADDMGVAQLRIPPHSIEAESSVLGGLLLDNAAWDHVGDLLADSDFYRFEHRLVFAACARLINASKPADVVTVYAELQREGNGDEVGGLAYLNSLAQYVPSAYNARRYAEIVREKSVLRQIVTATEKASAIAFAGAMSPAQAIEQAMALLSGIDVRHGAREPRSVESLAVEFLDHVSDMAEGRVAAGISTGLPTLDNHLGGGLKPGRQVVVAARPSIGKSSLTAQILLNVAAAGVPCLLLSQEMETQELMGRIVAALGRADVGGLANGKLDSDGWARVAEGVDRLRGMPLYLHSESGLSVAAIRAIVRKMVRQHGVKVVALDYLQLCAASAERTASNRHHQLEELSRGLKALAMELGVTTIVLSQLNREVEKRTGGRPILSDLKESGSIEEDADGVILLSREGELSDGSRLIRTEVPKSRGGRAGGVCHMRFEESVQAWSETTERPPQQHGRNSTWNP